MQTLPRATALPALGEKTLRRVAARATHQVALRRGNSLGMSIGCGYPKSGTVWLCQLMGSYLGVPYPRLYYSPIAMKSVIHAHWRWDPRLPRTAYIIRDGRDVMVSFYFYTMRLLQQTQRPAVRQQLLKKYGSIFGRDFDPGNARENLPHFIEHAMQHGPSTHGIPWHEHVADWSSAGRHNVVTVRYEDLLANTTDELTTLMAALTQEVPNKHRAQLAASRFSFLETTGRANGQEDLSNFQRKGTAGDWRNHFNREAGEVFDAFAGQTLIDCGYASNRNWFHSLTAA